MPISISQNKKPKTNKSLKKKYIYIVLLLIVICSLSALILTLTLCNHKKTMTNITWTQDSFDYDNSDHTISVTNVPVGSTVTYTGGEDGTNGAKNDGLYTINATITNPNYHTWKGTHTLTIIFPENGIKLQDGSFYTIDVSGNFCNDRVRDGTFNFQDINGSSYTIDRTAITEIHLTNLPQITNAGDNYLHYLCYNMTNLTVANIIIPNTITTAGNWFLADLFTFTQLSSIPSTFNIPQQIVGTVGSYFCYNMFNSTPLSSLPSGFNLPQGITDDGTYFCDSMFESCTSLVSLPQGFNLPQGITDPNFNHHFCYQMFQWCSGLENNSTNLVTIHIPYSTETNNFCGNMFYGCSGLTGVPETPTSDTNVLINAN